MKSTRTVAAVALGLLVLGAGRLAAQQPYPNYLSPLPTSPYARPQLSPYLNLLRGGSPSANYYLGVIPERDRRRNERALGTAVQDLERRGETPALPGEDLVPRLPSTGHPAYFMNYATYFNLGAGPLPNVGTAQQNSSRGARGR